MTLMEKDTKELERILKTASPLQVKDYLEKEFAGGEPSFPAYMDVLLQKKGMKRQDVLLRANLPQKYGYKLFTGESHTTDRDKLLRICFSMEMSLTEVQRTLKLYGMNELYAKNKRDVLLITALHRRIFDIDQVNELLTAENFAPLYIAEE